MNLTKTFKGILTLLFVLALVLYLKSIEWNLLLRYVIGAKPIIFLTLLVSFLILIIKSYKLKLIVNSGNKKITMSNSIFVQISSVLLAMITPGRLGEFSKIYFLKKKGVTLVYSIFSLLLERLSDIFILLLGSFFFIQKYISLDNLIYDYILLAIIILLVLVFVFFFYFGEKIRHFFLKKNYAFLNKTIIKDKTIKGFLLKIIFPKNKLIIIPVITITIITWLFEGFMSWLVFLSLGFGNNFLIIAGILYISTIASLFSIFPLGLGLFDFSYIYLITQVGVPKEAAVVALLWIRLVGLIIIFLTSIVYLGSQGRSILKLKHVRID